MSKCLKPDVNTPSGGHALTVSALLIEIFACCQCHTTSRVLDGSVPANAINKRLLAVQASESHGDLFKDSFWMQRIHA